jgi:hypothetical protein
MDYKSLKKTDLIENFRSFASNDLMNMTQTKKTILSLAFFALTTCFSQNAKASQIYEFDWQFYSWDNSMIGSGKLVSVASNTPNYENVPWGGQNLPVYQITGISGTLLGHSLTGLFGTDTYYLDPRSTENVPGTNGGQYLQNNWTFLGSFTTDIPNKFYTIDAPYGRYSVIYERALDNPNTSLAVGGGYSLSTPAAVPEPSALSLIVVGLSGLALIRRRK